MYVLVITTSRRAAWCDVLRSSVQTHHPGATVVALLCDGRPDPTAADGLRLADVDLGELRAVDLILGLGARAAGWAALPWVLDAAVAAGSLPDGPLLVLDDTMVLLDDVHALVDAAAATGAAARAAHRDRTTGLGWGGCLPGALALSGREAELLSWWRARRTTLLGSTAAHPVEELWGELPVGAGVASVAAPALRCSARTVGELELALDGDRVTADGEPVALVDLEGLDPRRPWWFAPDDGEPRRHVSESAPLRELLRAGADRLRSAGWSAGDDDTVAVPGVAETAELRRWYRSLLGQGTPPPNPYVPGQVGQYLDLLAAPDPDGPTAISVHADLVFAARPDLRAAFPAVRWSDRDHVVRWMWGHGLAEGQTSLALLPDLPAPRQQVVTVAVIIAVPGPSVMFVVGQALAVGRPSALAAWSARASAACR